MVETVSPWPTYGQNVSKPALGRQTISGGPIRLNPHGLASRTAGTKRAVPFLRKRAHSPRCAFAFDGARAASWLVLRTSRDCFVYGEPLPSIGGGSSASGSSLSGSLGSAALSSVGSAIGFHEFTPVPHSCPKRPKSAHDAMRVPTAAAAGNPHG